jgi:hypothetical protein
MLTSILPDPLHPAVVHLRIALMLLLPPFASGEQAGEEANR